MVPDEKTPLVDAAKNEEKSGLSPPLLLALEASGVLAVTILLIEVLVVQQGWDRITATYVLTQIVTTVGYGDEPWDIENKPAWYQIFVAIYAIGALALFSINIGAHVDKVVTSRAAVLSSHLEGTESVSKRLIPVFSTGAVALVFVISGMVWFVVEDGKSVAESFYASVITVTSIGFGEYSFSRNKWTKLFGIGYMLFGIAAFASFLGALALFFESQQTSRSMSLADATADIDDSNFNKIDRDGNGYLDRSEFLAFVLIKYEIIDEELLDNVFKEYNQFEGARDRKVTLAQIKAFQRSTRVLDGGAAAV